VLDINIIRNETEKVIESLSKRGADFSGEIQKIRELDIEWRKQLKPIEELKREKNVISKEIGLLKREGKEVSEKIQKMKELKNQIKQAESGEPIEMSSGETGKRYQLEEDIKNKMLLLPNLPDNDIGLKDEIIRQEGVPKEFDFEVRPHWEAGEILKILDFKTATKLSGSRFALLKAEGAELERALISFMLDIHKDKHGYTEIIPPYLVREETMTGTGQLPKFREEMYILQEDNLCLIPTAEVPLANIHAGEIMDSADLPKKYVAYTPCFRREAGSYGRDTSGLIRNHQFNKVELVNIVRPEDSDRFQEQLLAESEEILKLLGLTYRVILLGTTEMGFSASKTYDLEVWMPGEKKWREVSSCSNCRDFQARRMNTRYRDEKGNTAYVHTLNSSGVAVGRTFAAVLENFQTKELNVEIPESRQKN